MSSSINFYLLILMALFHLCLSNGSFHDMLCMDVERQALVDFKHGLIDEANRLASWVDEKSDCCTWYGIVCDNITGHVHEVHLPGLDGECDKIYYTHKEDVLASNHRLKGNLRESLLHLKQLRHLDLSCNDFGGIQVPSFIASLSNLRYLNLSSSKFGKIVPPQLGNLSKLQVMSLGSSFEPTSMVIKNMQWLSGLRMLRHLDISGVDLSKVTEWLHIINTLPYLVQLHLKDCNLSHIHSYVHSLNLTSLSLLKLSFNDFNSFVPQWIFRITSLVSLDLSRCNFLGIIPSCTYSFPNLTSLKMLYFYGNDFQNSSSVLKELSSSNLVELDISSCGVSSSLLESLNNLTSLLSLDVSNNVLTKTLPESLVNVCNLKKVSLSSNYFENNTLTNLLKNFLECKSPVLESLYIAFSGLSGPIPYSIGQLSSLKYLDLYSNELKGSLPESIQRLSSLKLLDISSNQLSGNLPHSIAHLSKLEVFLFSDNLMTGVVTEVHFANLVSLKHLDGRGNNFTLKLLNPNWIPPFQIQYLFLEYWDLGSLFPLWFQSQKHLKILDISNTHISSLIPDSFWSSFPTLIILDMSGNQIQGTLKLLHIPATLEVLDLSRNDFYGTLPSLSNGLSLTILDLSNNSFEGSLHHLLFSSYVSQIKELNLGNNRLSGVMPECWEKWSSLEFLNLESNNLSGEIPRTLGSVPHLRLLNIHGNKIFGELPASLMNLSYLEILQLNKNELVGSIPTWIGTKISYLRILNLRSNNFNGNIPEELCHLKFVQILDLAHNYLSGNIPRCFNNFSVLSGIETYSDVEFVFFLEYGGSTAASDSLVMKNREDIYENILALVMLLDLSSNNLSGLIPSELTSLCELQSLNLSRNHLTGRIPDKIGDMKALVSIDVSLNKLYGQLPQSLTSLSFLSCFNVSYNNLTGRVPISTQLQSFNESAFLGNNLCGDPLANHCLQSDTHEEKEGNRSHGKDQGLIISIMLGFVTGFCIIVIPLIVCKPWRIRYFHAFLVH